MVDEQTKVDVPQQRSPAFPYIALDAALERAKTIYERVRDHAQPREVLAKAYGKPATSSATIQTFATLGQYGLLENVVTPTGRRMRVTRLAQDIINPHAPAAKIAQGLKVAALHPTVFRELYEKFGTATIDDSVPLYYLTNERLHEHGLAFSDKGAKDVLRVYRATLAFAGIEEGDSNQVPASSPFVPPSTEVTAKVGDLVQVEINGALGFLEHKRVEEIQEHEGKVWVFLEGETSGVQMDQVTVVAAAETPPAATVPPIRSLPRKDQNETNELPEGWSEERLIDDGGDEIKIRYNGKATVQRYEFIRDYLDFKIKRLAKKD